MELSWSRISLKLAGAFRTAKAVRTDKETLWVRLSHDEVEGWGEATPMDTYRQTLESSEQALAGMRNVLTNAGPFEMERTVSQFLVEHDDQRAAVAAVDAAWHDWLGKRFGVPVYQFLGLDGMQTPATSLSIGLDTPDKMADRARSAGDATIFKLKVGTADDKAILQAIRAAAPNKTIRVDANAAWTADVAMERLAMLAEFGVEFVEQPVARDDLKGLRRLTEAAILPIVADESCVREADVARVAGCVDGINIKLSKCGGIRSAMTMIRLARGFDLRVMLGCMVESTLATAAAVQLAPLADWLDLDGNLLLSEEPFEGPKAVSGRFTMRAEPGLGVRRRESGQEIRH